MSDNERTERIVVVGHNAGGDPDVLLVEVSGTEGQLDNGDFYVVAKAVAEQRSGFEVAAYFDSSTPAWRALKPDFMDWSKAHKCAVDDKGKVVEGEAE